MLELANGCLCCSIKDRGVAAIEKLMERKGAFDHILLETTGLADPAPIVELFWRNEEYVAGLANQITLDAVICVVDAFYGLSVRSTNSYFLYIRLKVGKQQIQTDLAADDIGESVRYVSLYETT